MKYILLLLLLSGCARSADEMGVKNYYDWDCVKSESTLAPGFSSNGKFTTSVVTTCVIAKCFYFEKEIGKYCWNDKILSKKLVSDDKCVGEYSE